MFLMIKKIISIKKHFKILLKNPIYKEVTDIKGNQHV